MDSAPIFVIQRHEASRLHYDFRLEHDGVLVSWALPKGVPDDPARNHLAVQTEDHPMDYAAFEGDIPKGEYGAGHVDIWDEGTFELEKWKDGREIIATLHGRRGSHRYALIHTRDDDWLIHLMAPAGAQGDTRTTAAEPTARSATRPASRRTAAAPARASRAASTSPADPAFSPMLATLGELRSFDREADWVFELKWDGIRAIATVRGGRVTLRSRNGLDLTPSYPELQALASAVRGDAVLDGEIVALDASGRPDFGLLQQRMGLTRERDVAAARRGTPVHLFVFDLLEHDGVSLVDEPYERRRELLREIVPSRGPVQVPPDVGDDVDDAIETSRELRLEGVMAKVRDSPYRGGRRSRDWVKLKHHRMQEVVVVGWRPGGGSREGGVGSLLLGIPEQGELRYVGRVGTGFTQRDLEAMAARFAGMAQDAPSVTGVPRLDARDARWLTPTLVGEVEYQEVTRDGRLRQPSWRGWRDDKRPDEVQREQPDAADADSAGQ